MESLVDMIGSVRSIKVNRNDLTNAITACYCWQGSKSLVVTFKCGNGGLVVQGPAYSQRIEGTGGSAWTAHCRTSFDKFASNLPAAAEIEIDFDGKYIDIGGYRIKALVGPPRKVGDAMDSRLDLAMVALEPFGVTRMQLAVFCVRPDPTPFTPQDQATIDRIAQAWAALAPYGVTTDALRQLVADNLREALKLPRTGAVHREGTK